MEALRNLMKVSCWWDLCMDGHSMGSREPLDSADGHWCLLCQQAWALCLSSCSTGYFSMSGCFVALYMGQEKGWGPRIHTLTERNNWRCFIWDCYTKASTTTTLEICILCKFQCTSSWFQSVQASTFRNPICGPATCCWWSPESWAMSW
jgi:hypothetical protein